jgi:hypothetical protein
MMVWLIILAVLLFIALLRFGVALRYNEGGLNVWARVGFLSFKIYPAKKKRVRKKPKKKSVLSTKITEALSEFKPQSIKEIKGLFSDLKSRLSSIKRKILIKRLEVEYTAAGNDPSSTAITFGRANVLAGLASAVLQDMFRIKHCDFRVLADFESEQQRISIDLVITMAVWEALYVFFTLLAFVFSTPRTSKIQNTYIRKEVKENG